MKTNARKPVQGSLANTGQRKYTPREQFLRGEGLDWDRIMNHGGDPLPPHRQLTLDELDRANRGLDNHYELPKEERKKKLKEKKPKGNTGRGLKFDVDEAVRLYTEEHLTPAEIAERVGVKTAATIISKLKQREVYDPNKYRAGGPHSRIPKVRRPADSYIRK